VAGGVQTLSQSAPRRRFGPSLLTSREVEILALLAAGLQNKAIAERLHIALNTVRSHVQCILYKLDAHSRLEAVAIAVGQGVIAR
jgi:DNA-binding NarL/FixJ family response regulator